MNYVEPKTVTLVVRYTGEDGKPHRAPAARGKNGRVRPGYAVVNGEQVLVQIRGYELRYYENRQAKYMPAGLHAAEADARRARMELESSAVKAAAAVGARIEIADNRTTLAASARSYIADAENRGANEAAAQARLVTREFMQATKRTYVDEVTREDFFRFRAVLAKRGCSDRTIANKDQRLRSWLAFAGIPRPLPGNPKPDDIMPPPPKHDVKLPTIYTRDQISSILGCADAYLNVAIEVALKCGLRERELAHLEWTDLNFEERVLRVRSKPKWKHRVKDCEERDIPLPSDLIETLRAYREKVHRGPLVLATKGGRPNGHLLRAIKRLAGQNGLNCGVCSSCRGAATGERKGVSEAGECQEWTLHRFRRTYCTTLLRNGVDLRTAQHFMGHADLESTMRYLRPAASTEVQDKLDAIEWS